MVDPQEKFQEGELLYFHRVAGASNTWVWFRETNSWEGGGLKTALAMETTLKRSLVACLAFSKGIYACSIRRLEVQRIV